MITLGILLLGLMLGSFVNALVWRLHQQTSLGKGNKAANRKIKAEELSILRGRSMCPHCNHSLAASDLIPVFSWVLLKGKCRYCNQPISWQYPLVELATAFVFVISYLYWPLSWDTVGVVNFIVWLIILTGLMSLIVYDLKWMLLPNRIVYPLIAMSAFLTLYNLLMAPEAVTLAGVAFSLLIAAGLFWAIFELSRGKWIGGGDVKLGILIGFLLADPYKAFLMLLLASVLGTLVVVPGMLLKKLTPKSRIPFGPFLITSTIIVYLFGAAIIEWYKRSLLLSV